MKGVHTRAGPEGVKTGVYMRGKRRGRRRMASEVIQRVYRRCNGRAEEGNKALERKKEGAGRNSSRLWKVR